MQKKWIATLFACALAAGGGAYWLREGPATVVAVETTRGPAVEAIYATGVVEPTVMAPIAPRQGGRLAELLAGEGSRVRKGQALAKLDDEDMRNAVEELAARARYARQQFERVQEVVRRKLLARNELDRARADLDAAEAALKRAEAQRAFMTLTAPADGLILKRDGEIGQFIPAGQAVFSISCCAPLRVAAEVDEEDIPRARVGQKVVLRADAFPDRIFDGEVQEITPKGDPVARSYRVRIRLDDPDGLQVGMTVDANLVVAERQNALLIPAAAIQDGAAWVAAADGTLHRRTLRIGATGAARSEILGGLQPGDRVVEGTAAELREGRAARVRPSGKGNGSKRL
jgi:RND family efflux transporter MFP subunit